MPTEIRVPSFGESVVEATVGRWLKKEGDAVAAGEPVVELETEKVNAEVSAETDGILTSIQHREGETVHAGDVLATIGPVGAGAARPAPPQGPEAAPAAARLVEEVKARQPSAPAQPERARVSPAAQRAAEELKVDLAGVSGTGPGGRIMKEDVEAAARKQAPPQAAPAPAPPTPAPVAPAAAAPPAMVSVEAGREEVRQRLSRRRLTIARRLVEAQHTAAMLTTFNEIDMSAVVGLRRRRRETFKERTGTDLGYMPFFVKAVVGALKAFPKLNSELQGEELVLKRYYDIGIATADPEGLVVPVLRDADRMTFAQIESAIAAFVQKARDRSLSLEDLRGGTFTITNGGVFGSLLSTPILNPPQVGILGMHKISERPVVVSGQVVIHPVMYVALSYDHRVVDGREAVLFLVRVKELIEDPEMLLLEA